MIMIMEVIVMGIHMGLLRRRKVDTDILMVIIMREATVMVMKKREATVMVIKRMVTAMATVTVRMI